MSKPLVFVRTKIRIDNDPEETDSWELLAIDKAHLMHAAWNPIKQMLVCQFDSVKESFQAVPKKSNSGKVTTQVQKVDEYYRVTIGDTDAIQNILDNFVVNYDGQEWKISVEPEEALVAPA